MRGMMKAARLHAVRGGDGLQTVFRADELPIPDVIAGEVLVRVLRAGLNRGDVDLRERKSVSTAGTAVPSRFCLSLLGMTAWVKWWRSVQMSTTSVLGIAWS